LNGAVPAHPLLPADDVADRLRALPRWRVDGDTIRASYECPSFADAVAFVVRVGFLAEAADHHPDLDVRWRTVHVALTTHDSGGITEADLALAGRIDAVA
jgi:4a-hydroxytetrahydrobiopterin dehydratase